MKNVCAGSKITADVYLRTLGLFCELNNTDPQKIVNMAKESTRKFKEDFMDFVRSLEKQGMAESYI
ncbi:MAG: site-specific integrase, partial [Thermoplasmata archaeon]